MRFSLEKNVRPEKLPPRLPLPLQPSMGRDTHRRHHVQCGPGPLWHGDSCSINAARPFCSAGESIPFAVLNVIYAVSLFLLGGLRWVVTAATPSLLRALCHLVIYRSPKSNVVALVSPQIVQGDVSLALNWMGKLEGGGEVLYMHKREAKAERGGQREVLFLLAYVDTYF